MVLESIETQYYGDEDAFPRSPLLEAVTVKYKPSPTPPPRITIAHQAPSSQNNRPTQGDLVLIREMEPNRPDIAQQVSETALNSDSESSPEPDDDDRQDSNHHCTAADFSRETSADVKTNTLPTIQEVLRCGSDPKPAPVHRDSVIEEHVFGRILTDRRASQTSLANGQPNGLRDIQMAASMGAPSLPSTVLGVQHSAATAINGQHHRASISTSTNLQQLTIPQRNGPPADTLAAIQAPSPVGDPTSSPGHQQTLPGFHAIDDIARSATSEHDGGRANSFVHRQSVSSVGTSPSSIVRQLSISAHSPATPFPSLSASSPLSAREDIFLRSSGGGAFGVDARRPSHAASDNGPYPATVHSASTSESYQSSDGLSPGTHQTPIEGRPRHMSLDGALNTRILPPPPGSGIQHVPSHGAGAFRCDWPGCTAAPFQTQYLLNSHTNVHSQNRPHYCPVKECPRGEGGKGFKRKNEMIRHGLVHQSPGYVCPFCPDREHKYPRPDNLQRHVRVHHVDKDKDDPQLRDVLAQRPEGGSRGRRRRVSESGR
ncbi:hypothetical protein ACN47E_006273 [Coniothyrium glycines]